MAARESTPLSSEAQKQLMLLMTQHQRRIFGYLYTLVPDRHDAEDLLQETSLVICEKFHEFRPGTGQIEFRGLAQLTNGFADSAPD